MEKINLTRYQSTNSNHLTTFELIECYREVFAGNPWNEWLKCSSCGQTWGKDQLQELINLNFQHCQQPIADFWPRDLVIQDLKQELNNQSSCWLAINEANMVLGFAWGYSINLENLEKKLNAPLSKYFNLKNQQISYQDEIGVIKAYRQKKIATKLMANCVVDFLNQGLTYNLARTRELPVASPLFIWYTQKLNYQIIYRYPLNDGRVILGRSLFGLLDLINI